ncbi:MAG: hypothetical protein HZB33_14635 [Nitrospirae bacterium]|nr:hypothetical protein [Nitrospirota bacterium]
MIMQSLRLLTCDTGVKFGRIFMLVLTVLMTIAGVMGLHALDSYAADELLDGSILFFVRDSETTYGIGGATIEVYEDSQLITTLIADDSGHVRFDARKRGRYDFKTKAEGYREAYSKNLKLDPAGKEIGGEVMLTPLAPPKELDAAAIEALQNYAEKKNEIVFMGYVVDAKRGKPIEEVSVQVLTAKKHGVTDTKGFFSIRFPSSPQPADPAIIPPLESLLFEKSGYTSYEYQNLPTHSGVRIFRITLEHGSGKKINKKHIRQLPQSESQLQSLPADDSKSLGAQDTFSSKSVMLSRQSQNPVDPPDDSRQYGRCVRRHFHLMAVKFKIGGKHV